MIVERASQNFSLILNGVLVGSNQTTGGYIELNTNGEIYIGENNTVTKIHLLCNVIFRLSLL